MLKKRGLNHWLIGFWNAKCILESAKRQPNSYRQKKKVPSIEEAIAGAQDIIAEHISDDAELRKWIRAEIFKAGKVISTEENEEKDEKKIFEMYYEYEEPVQRIVPHRVLALNRGEKEEVLRNLHSAPV